MDVLRTVIVYALARWPWYSLCRCDDAQFNSCALLNRPAPFKERLPVVGHGGLYSTRAEVLAANSFVCAVWWTQNIAKTGKTSQNPFTVGVMPAILKNCPCFDATPH